MDGQLWATGRQKYILTFRYGTWDGTESTRCWLVWASFSRSRTNNSDTSNSLTQSTSSCSSHAKQRLNRISHNQNAVRLLPRANSHAYLAGLHRAIHRKNAIALPHPLKGAGGKSCPLVHWFPTDIFPRFRPKSLFVLSPFARVQRTGLSVVGGTSRIKVRFLLSRSR